jgi:hypothetical protein
LNVEPLNQALFKELNWNKRKAFVEYLIYLLFEKVFFCKSYVKHALPGLTPAVCPYKILA